MKFLKIVFFNLIFHADLFSVMSFHIDYKNTSSELCLIGKKYDTDKSSQREEGHSHPYTLFYHSIFKNKRDAELNIAELGILNGESLLMWRDYFTNANLYGFDNDADLISVFQNNYRIALAEMDVQDVSSLIHAFQTFNIQYDLIIDDSTHQFEDQLRIIENAHHYLKPGGMLIIEDVFKCYNEEDYINRLLPVLDEFQDYYFVTMDHENRRSTGWDNDKLFVLVKKGDESIFRCRNKITVITPSMRPQNLLKIKDSIDFDYVDEWIIVYDGGKILENPHLFANESKIKEYIHTSEGISGNPQRNFAIDHVQNEDTYLYFLDDDNFIHKDFYKILDIIEDGKIVTFNQENRLKGNLIQENYIDTAMFLIDFKLCKEIRWALNIYAADALYIIDCYTKNKDKWIFIDNTLCTYNNL